MPLSWKNSAFGTPYLHIGDIRVGATGWYSPGHGAPEDQKGYLFRSELLSGIPKFAERLKTFYPSDAAARQAGEDLAVEYAAYVIREVHGVEAFKRITEGS